MPKEEIITGIKNGIARGETLQQAMQTLIAAGYNADDVNEASNQINSGVLSRMPLPQTPATVQNIQNAVQPQPVQSLPVQQTIQQNQETAEKKKLPTGLIIAVIILGVFLLTLGGLMLFGEKILDAIA